MNKSDCMSHECNFSKSSVFYLNYIFSPENGNEWLQKGGGMTWVLNEQELIGLSQSGPQWPILPVQH